MTSAEKEAYIAKLQADGHSALVISRQREALNLPPDPSLVLDNTLPEAKLQPVSANITDLRGVEAQARRFQQRPASPRKPRAPKRKEVQPQTPVDTVTRWDLLELGEAA